MEGHRGEVSEEEEDLLVEVEALGEGEGVDFSHFAKKVSSYCSILLDTTKSLKFVSNACLQVVFFFACIFSESF